jgi:predicted P-loop ATPase
MLDIDAVLDGKKGSPRLTDLLKAAQESYKKGDQRGVDSRVVSHLEMQTGRDGVEKIKPTVPNLLAIMEKDKRWKNKVWLNEFSNAIYMNDDPLKDTDYTRIKRGMYKHYNVHFSTDSIVEATNYVSEANGKNPLTDWLHTNVWDGVPRIDEWLIRGCGAVDNELNREIGRRWLVQCVARAMDPGCKADCVLILVGPQGAKKSTTFRVERPTRLSLLPMKLGHDDIGQFKLVKWI